MKNKTLIYTIAGIFFSLLSVQTYAYHTDTDSTGNPGIFTDKDDMTISGETKGQPIDIDGIAWNGFQDSATLEGLYNSAFDKIKIPGENIDFQGIVNDLLAPWGFSDISNIKTEKNGVRFKTIRLPIEAGTLGLDDPSVPPDVRPLWKNEDIDPEKEDYPFERAAVDLTSKSNEIGNGALCDWSRPLHQYWGCTPPLTTPDLLKLALKAFQNKNLRVMIDVHHSPGMGDELYRDQTVVSDDLTLTDYYNSTKIFANYVKAQKLTNVIGIDIANEPALLYWYQKNPTPYSKGILRPEQPAYINVIAAAANAIYNTDQNLLVMVEGPSGATTNGLKGETQYNYDDPDDPLLWRKNEKNKNKVRGMWVKCAGFPNENYVKYDTTGKKPKIIPSLMTGGCGSDYHPKAKGSNDGPYPTPVGSAAKLARINIIGSNWGENFRPLLKKDPSGLYNNPQFDVGTFRSKLISAIIENATDTAESYSPKPFGTSDQQTANKIADWLLGSDNNGVDGHLVFLPHLYGSKVATWQPTTPEEASYLFDINFGFLKKSGFPVAIGELGFDKKIGGEDFFKQQVAPYLESHGMQHDLFFWTLNNIDAPRGLLQDGDLGNKGGLFAWKEQDLHDLFHHAVGAEIVWNQMPTATVKGTSATINWEAYVANGTGKIDDYTVTLDSEKPINASTKTTYTFEKLTPGKHTVQVQASDSRDNLTSTSKLTSFTIGGGSPITIDGTSQLIVDDGAPQPKTIIVTETNSPMSSTGVDAIPTSENPIKVSDKNPLKVSFSTDSMTETENGKTTKTCVPDGLIISGVLISGNIIPTKMLNDGKKTEITIDYLCK